MTTLEEMLYRPDAAGVLSLLDDDELRGSGGRSGGVTTEFYRRLVVERGNKGREGDADTSKVLANVRWRRRVLDFCAGSPERQTAVWTMCSRDILFWVNTFCWTYDPRNLGSPSASGLRRLPKQVPFVTWKYQDDAFRLLQWCVMNGVDGLIEKSRDMGASWIFLTLFDWFFLFRPMETFLMVSRKEDLVDKKDNPDCLYWKLEFLHSNMPGWMVPEISRSKLHMRNENLGGTIDGDSTTGDVGRGGRRTALGLDEFAAVEEAESQAVLNATNDTTDCRIFNSTPKGAVGAYYEQTKRDDILKVRMHWTMHPHKTGGLYTCEKGKCPIHPEGGHPHSKWYDRECRRRGYNPVAIAQELDIDYSRAGGAFFNVLVLEPYISEVCRYRLFRGELEYAPGAAMPEGFAESESGNLAMWIAPALDGSIPEGDYAVGVDIAEGTGASFSCISVGNLLTGEKVADYANPNIKPYELARYAVSLCRAFGDAFLVWEANGPGREFGDEVLKLGYGNIYRRAQSGDIRARSRFPGWQSTADEKTSVFGSYRRALAERTFLNRNKDAVKECFKYVTDANGVPEYQGGSFDLGRIGQSHGDIVVADALLNFAFEQKGLFRAASEEESEPEVPASCFWRRMQEASQSSGSWLDSRFS